MVDSKSGYADSRTASLRDLSWLHCCLISTSITSLIPSPGMYGYADDLAILTAHWEWKKTESTLSQKMSTLALYPRQWRLKLSEGKTTSTVFHLNNKEAKRELGVYINTRRLNLQPTTTYLGVKLDRTLSKTHQPIRCEPKLQLSYNHWMLTTYTCRAAPCTWRHPTSRAS